MSHFTNLEICLFLFLAGAFVAIAKLFAAIANMEALKDNFMRLYDDKTLQVENLRAKLSEERRKSADLQAMLDKVHMRRTDTLNKTRIVEASINSAKISDASITTGRGYPKEIPARQMTGKRVELNYAKNPYAKDSLRSEHPEPRISPSGRSWDYEPTPPVTAFRMDESAGVVHNSSSHSCDTSSHHSSSHHDSSSSSSSLSCGDSWSSSSSDSGSCSSSCD